MEYTSTKRHVGWWLAGWLLLACSVQAAEPPVRPRQIPAIGTARAQPERSPTGPLRLNRPKSPQSASRPRLFEGTSLVRMGSRLAVVLGLFAGLLLVQRWLGGQRRSTLPTDVIQVYGRVSLTAKQQLLLVRVGERLLILLESGQGISRLAEITDPVEVGRLVERFRQDPTPRGNALAREFLGQIGLGESYRRA